MSSPIIISEFLGTFILLAGILFTGNALYIAAAFLAAITIASVSGSHLNPAVSIAMVAKGSLKLAQLPQYILPQIAGALFALYVYQQVKPSAK